jgi:hypothetical protein
MPTLSIDLRNKLERTCIAARNLAERAAKDALRALAVHEDRSYDHMSDDQRKLRKKLVARAKAVGDTQDAKGQLAINHLAQEGAYEHWHRMVFARFLAENNLLIEPDMGVAVSLEECKELAKDAKTNLWALAGRYAQTLLPEIFRPDDPVLHVPLAREDQLKLEELLDALTKDTFTASDSLGWCYQFWQAERKDQVNAAGNKIGADELPSVTQLFTEDYMVDFLLDNTLGAWHAGKALAATKLAENAKSEDELRKAVALLGCPWKYLRFIKGKDGKGKDGKWTPAAGTFDGWPKTAKELKCLDPCMGSGHFVVAMFERLVALRMAEEKLDEVAAVAAVIRDNLFGLEIDPRCTQIGAFNLALAAWRRVGHRPLPAMNLACSGLAPNTREGDWLKIAGDNQKLQRGMERLYRLFQKAAVLGSLINPRAGEGDLLVAAFHELQPLLEKAMAQETKDDTAHEMAVTARGLAKAAEILAGQFTLVATNVPYVTLRKQSPVLNTFTKDSYPAFKQNLATSFIARLHDFCAGSGVCAVVTPQDWLFLDVYEEMRRSLLLSSTWNYVIRLGTKAFRSPMWDMNILLFICSASEPHGNSAFAAEDVSEFGSADHKSDALSQTRPLRIGQMPQLENPDARIVFEISTEAPPLSQIATALMGVSTGDGVRFNRYFWEVPILETTWDFLQSTVSKTRLFGGESQIIRWEQGRGEIYELAQSVRHLNHSAQNWARGRPSWGQVGVVISQMGDLSATLYLGNIYDCNCCAIVPNDPTNLLALWSFCQTAQFSDEVRVLNQALKVPPHTLLKIPFDLAHWQKVAAEKYPHGLPKPFSSDPTQWLFNGQPKGADQPLHVAVARLLGYQWPRQTGSSFPDCPALGPDGLEKLADDDGIVCLPSVRGEEPAAERLEALLAAAGVKPAKARELAVGADLDDWLRNGFFEEHCKMFHDRPFVSHIWDGRKRDGFHALVNYHKLCEGKGKGRKLLESLTYSYLGEWMTRQKDGVKRGEGGAEDRLAAALELQKRLEAILEGEPPFDLFVRWKPLAEQPIGWEPDINDGVRLNIRPFLASDLPTGRTGAGVLRSKPNVKWTKDRGKEPERPKAEYPWFWGWDEKTESFLGGKTFDGNRWNDCHYTNKVKQAARDTAGKDKL